MNRKFRCLDLFCGAGGASMGLHQAGFEVTGVDFRPQPHYPFEFHGADALTFPLADYDCYWASPPCQFVTRAGQQWRNRGRQYPDLIGGIRARLMTTEKPYIVENVAGEPWLRNPIRLNGAMFGLLVCRTRYFECNFRVPLILLPKEPASQFRMGHYPQPGDVITPVGHFSGVAYARQQMGIDWMTGKELSQAIPPAYAEFLGRLMLAEVEREEIHRAIDEELKCPVPIPNPLVDCPKCPRFDECLDDLSR